MDHKTLCTTAHISYLEREALDECLTIKDHSEAAIEGGAEYFEMDISVSQENREKGFCLSDGARHYISIPTNTIYGTLFHGIPSASYHLKLMKNETTTFHQVYDIRGVRLNNDGLHLLLRSKEG